jgi:hypothetical protein
MGRFVDVVLSKPVRQDELAQAIRGIKSKENSRG